MSRGIWNRSTAIALIVTAIPFAGFSKATADDPAPIGDAAATRSVAGATPAAAHKPGAPLEWLTTLEKGRREALAEGRPVLVRAGARWCGWCEKLADVLEAPELQAELRGFSLVYLDVDISRTEARELGIGSIPALRTIDRAGKVAATQDGFLEQRELIAWLRKARQEATSARPPRLPAEKPLEPDDVPELIAMLGVSDAIQREAAVRRLLKRPKLAATPVVDAFGKATGKAALATRLAALALLQEWGAPVGTIDPWRPETLTPQSQAALAEWAVSAVADLHQMNSELTVSQRGAAEREMTQLLNAGDLEADVLIERLARRGPGLGPLVAERLKTEATDRARERLLALRYRLAASDSLVANWPGGLSRLAASEVKIRHKAAQELADRSSAEDESLLLELFSDPDPLVREISLRALQRVGTEASSNSLLKLLEDPEPNIRAAVLKQLAEAPSPQVAAKIAAYAKQESDADLVVHAVRVLKEAKATENLMELLDHENWRVRAEAAEALGAAAATRHDEKGAEMFVALIALLDDSDGFVVSRALQALKQVDLPSAVEPLAKAAVAHPELAMEAVKVLTHTDVMRKRAEPFLQKYVGHENPQLRAAVIAALIANDSENVEQIVVAGLTDPEPSVRQATAEALFGMFETQFENPEFAALAAANPTGEANFLDAIKSMFGGRARRAKPQNGVKGRDDAQDDPTQETKADAQDEASPAGDQASNEATEADHGSAKPATIAHDEQGELADAWLREVYRGKHRPDWSGHAVEPLLKMLGSDPPRGRLAAALALVPLGHGEQALAELSTLVESDKSLIAPTSRVLPWLLWPQRREFFRKLVSLDAEGRQLPEVATSIAKNRDPRAAAELWQLLEHVETDASDVAGINSALMALYSGRTSGVYFGSATKLDKVTLAELTHFANDGTPWQRIVAMAQLIQLASGEPEVAARKMLDDSTMPELFRADAFQLLLLAESERKAIKLAVQHLASTVPEIRKRALIYLTRGQEGIQIVRGQLFVYSGRHSFMNSGESIAIETPPGVTEELVRPLLDDADPEVAACAGYMLATMGKPEGLDPLMRAWRGKEGDAWTVPVYSAIAALDDDRQTPILLEINKKLAEHEKRRFYWTIRSMHGPEVVKLRKHIRDEVGMDNLR